jgi:hypothetical protein
MKPIRAWNDDNDRTERYRMVSLGSVSNALPSWGEGNQSVQLRSTSDVVTLEMTTSAKADLTKAKGTQPGHSLDRYIPRVDGTTSNGRSGL